MNTIRHPLPHALHAGAAALFLAILGCQAPAQPSADDPTAAADAQRTTNPDVPAADLDALVTGTTAAACDLYRQVRHLEHNVFLSPLSISQALAMTYAGAGGTTAAQMERALHFTLPPARLHPAFNALELRLKPADRAAEGDAFALHVVNRLWAQEGLALRDAFRETLVRHYGAAVRLLDFQQRADAARREINAWVAQQTQERIQDLLLPGAVDAMTRLVLTNAVYFKAAWQDPFEAAQTRPAPFTKLDGQTADVPTMHGRAHLAFAAAGGCRAVELAYRGGDYAMLVLLPDAGTFAEFTAELDADRLRQIAAALDGRQVALALPKFTFTWHAELKPALAALGMPRAFDPEQADFSKMAAAPSLYISTVQHKAFVAVDEKGTEAAAATAVGVGVTAMPAEPIALDIDRPFVFLIRHRVSGAVLFLGHVVDPAAE